MIMEILTGNGGGGDSVLVNKKEWGEILSGGGGFCPTLHGDITAYPYFVTSK